MSPLRPTVQWGNTALKCNSDSYFMPYNTLHDVNYNTEAGTNFFVFGM